MNKSWILVRLKIAAIFLMALTKVSGFGEPFLYFFLAAVPLIICAALFFVVVRRAMLIHPAIIATAPGLRPPVSSNVGT